MGEDTQWPIFERCVWVVGEDICNAVGIAPLFSQSASYEHGPVVMVGRFRSLSRFTRSEVVDLELDIGNLRIDGGLKGKKDGGVIFRNLNLEKNANEKDPGEGGSLEPIGGEWMFKVLEGPMGEPQCFRIGRIMAHISGLGNVGRKVLGLGSRTRGGLWGHLLRKK